jgi:hypothetical protein
VKILERAFKNLLPPDSAVSAIGFVILFMIGLFGGATGVLLFWNSLDCRILGKAFKSRSMTGLVVLILSISDHIEFLLYWCSC